MILFLYFPTTCKNVRMNLPTIIPKLPPLAPIITILLGVIGTTLGVTNFIRDMSSSRVRLRIRCYPLAVLKPGNVIEEIGCVEVINLSSFPVTLKDVEFEPRRPISGNKIRRWSIVNNGCRNGKPLPVRIDPRDSVEVYYKNRNGLELMVKQSRRVIVTTACGKTFYERLKYYHDILAKYERNASVEENKIAV